MCRSAELLVILDVTRRLAEQRMVDPLLEYVATTVFELIPAERCVIIFFANDGTVEVQVARDQRGHPLDEPHEQHPPGLAPDAPGGQGCKGSLTRWYDGGRHP